MRGFSFVVAMLVCALGISSVAEATGGAFRRFSNRVEARAFNRGFNAGAKAQARANAVNHRAANVVAFNQHGLYGVNGLQVVRFNTFGTRTVVDAFGNVFEVDAFGNAVLRGNKGGFNQFGGFVGTVIHPFGAAVFVPTKVHAGNAAVFRTFGHY